MAAMAGMSFAGVASSSMGLFMAPLEQEFGWSRAQTTFGLSIYALIVVPLAPFVGAMVDRWGARQIAIGGVLLSGLAFAAFGLADGSSGQWLALWAVYSLAALGIRNIVWTAAVSAMFNTARGLALALTLSGSAISATVIPIVAQRLIDNQGWRIAYGAIGLGWGAVVLLVVLIFFKGTGRERRTSADGPVRSHDKVGSPGGLSLGQALRDPALIRVAVATLLIIVVTSSAYVHLIPILGERGVSRETGAIMAAVAGSMAVVGRLLTGWLLDRWNSGWINAAVLVGPALGFGMLLIGGSQLELIVLAVIGIGLALGSSIQLCVYLTGRFGGLRNYGKIFGVMSSLIAIGPGVGPFLAGVIYDVYGSYTPLLIAGIPATLLSAALVFGLGPYPDSAEDTHN